MRAAVVHSYVGQNTFGAEEGGKLVFVKKDMDDSNLCQVTLQVHIVRWLVHYGPKWNRVWAVVNSPEELFAVPLLAWQAKQNGRTESRLCDRSKSDGDIASPHGMACYRGPDMCVWRLGPDVEQDDGYLAWNRVVGAQSIVRQTPENPRAELPKRSGATLTHKDSWGAYLSQVSHFACFLPKRHNWD